MFSPWVALAVVVVMLTVVASYRQNVHAYPSGGGDYEVATVNLGPKFGVGRGQRAAGRLRADRRGVGLLRAWPTSARWCRGWPSTRSASRSIAVVVLTAMNLRGLRESGTAFAIPTYGFMIVIIGMLLTGFFRIFVLGDDLRAPSAGLEIRGRARA